jgi:hypothetical protein
MIVIQELKSLEEKIPFLKTILLNLYVSVMAIIFDWSIGSMLMAFFGNVVAFTLISLLELFYVSIINKNNISTSDSAEKPQIKPLLFWYIFFYYALMLSVYGVFIIPSYVSELTFSLYISSFGYFLVEAISLIKRKLDEKKNSRVVRSDIIVASPIASVLTLHLSTLLVMPLGSAPLFLLLASAADIFVHALKSKFRYKNNASKL